MAAPLNQRILVSFGKIIVAVVEERRWPQAALRVVVWGGAWWVLSCCGRIYVLAAAASCTAAFVFVVRKNHRRCAALEPVGRSENSIGSGGDGPNGDLNVGLVTVAAGSVRALWLIASKLAWGLSAGWWKPPAMFFKKRRVVSIGGSQNAGFVREVSLLDLPDLALESVLARLPAASLLQMAGVCKDLRVRCKSDYLWEALVFEKWGKLAGPSAYRNWCKNLALKKQQEEGSRSGQSRFWVWPLSCLWPSSWVNLVKECRGMNKKPPPLDSLMAWYWALETGRFWFPAQVYNREHGHVGFMLSCYDAELSYDNNTDSFRARYPPHGSRAVVVEEGVFWERLRAAPVDTPAHNLHISDCLNELTPGDHIEVQWRRNKEFPYGWWYGVVGHSETCNREIRHRCTCHLETTVWLEFNQYTPGSRWRRAAIDRKNHREEGNEAEGFYGGLRKLKTKEEISIWEKLWPAEVLE